MRRRFQSAQSFWKTRMALAAALVAILLGSRIANSDEAPLLKDPAVAREAAVLLGEWVASDDAELRVAATGALSMMNRQAEPALAALLECLERPDEATLVRAAGALEEIPSAKDVAVPLLERCLARDIQRLSIAESLAKLDPGNPYPRAAVRVALRTRGFDRETMDAKKRAILLIPRLENAYRHFFPTLSELLYDEDLQDEALDALFEMDLAGKDEAFEDEVVGMVWRAHDRWEDEPPGLSNLSAACLLYQLDRPRFVEELSRLIETGPRDALPLENANFWRATAPESEQLRDALIARLTNPQPGDGVATARGLIETLDDIGPGDAGLAVLVRCALREIDRESLLHEDVQSKALFALGQHADDLREQDLKRLRGALLADQSSELTSDFLFALSDDDSDAALELCLKYAANDRLDLRRSARWMLAKWAPDERAYQAMLKGFDEGDPYPIGFDKFLQHGDEIVARVEARLLSHERLDGPGAYWTLCRLGEMNREAANRIAAELLDDPAHPRFDDAVSYYSHEIPAHGAIREDIVARLADPKYSASRRELLGILRRFVIESGEIPEAVRALLGDADPKVRGEALYVTSLADIEATELEMRSWIDRAIDFARSDGEPPATADVLPRGSFASSDAMYEAESWAKLAFASDAATAMRCMKKRGEDGTVGDRVRIAELLRELCIPPPPPLQPGECIFLR